MSPAESSLYRESVETFGVPAEMIEVLIRLGNLNNGILRSKTLTDFKIDDLCDKIADVEFALDILKIAIGQNAEKLVEEKRECKNAILHVKIDRFKKSCLYKPTEEQKEREKAMNIQVIDAIDLTSEIAELIAN